MDLDIDDPNERPTLPAPISGSTVRAFDTPAEVFFACTVTLPSATHGEALVDELTEAEELTCWWVDQRRRALFGWVAAAVALCAGVLVAGLLAAPV